MAKIEFIITRLQMNWYDAVDYARSRAGWLPSIEMAKEYKLPLGWTCNTPPDSSGKALATDHNRFYKRTDSLPVIICGEQYTLQEFSFCDGDLQSHYIAPVEDSPNYTEIQEKWTRGIYTQAMLAEEYKMLLANVNRICKNRPEYYCIKCGNVLTKDSKPVHELTHHTFPQRTREEAVEELWPNYKI